LGVAAAAVAVVEEEVEQFVGDALAGVHLADFGAEGGGRCSFAAKTAGWESRPTRRESSLPSCFLLSSW
jgi:hypothetical protein